MLLSCPLEVLLWRMRTEPALYILGAGASAPQVPLAIPLLQRSVTDFLRVGSFSVEPAKRTRLTQRIMAAAHGTDYYPNRQWRPGTPAFPTEEMLLRVTDQGGRASLIYHLGAARLAQRPSVNYAVFSAFWPGWIVTFNLDGRACDACSFRHPTIDAHGTVDRYLGGPAGAQIASLAHKYGAEFRQPGLVLCEPEVITDQLHNKLLIMQLAEPTLVVIIGYSFGKSETGYDDHVSLDAFVSRFQGHPIDIFVLDPQPFTLAALLGERLRSNRVFPIQVYWNVLANVYTEQLQGRHERRSTMHLYEEMLDRHGSSNIILPAEHQ